MKMSTVTEIINVHANFSCDARASVPYGIRLFPFGNVRRHPSVQSVGTCLRSSFFSWRPFHVCRYPPALPSRAGTTVPTICCSGAVREAPPVPYPRYTERTRVPNAFRQGTKTRRRVGAKMFSALPTQSFHLFAHLFRAAARENTRPGAFDSALSIWRIEPVAHIHTA